MARKMRDSGVEWIGEVPEGWEVNYLSQSVSEVRNRNEGLKEKNLLSLSYGKIKRKSIDSIGGLLPASFEGYNIIAPNDIVLRLTDLQNDQHSLRVGLSHENGIVTSAYTTIRPCDRTHAGFLFYSLFAFDIAKGFYGMGAGVRQGLNYNEVKQIKLLSPSLPEQRRIADYLDEKCATIDGAIDELKSGIEDCKAWKKASIFEAVTGKANVFATKNAKGTKRKMRDSGIPWIGEIPEEWEVYKLKRYTSMLTPMRDKPVDLSGDVPWVRIEDYDGKYISCSKAGYGVSESTIRDMNLKVYPVGTVLCTSSCDLGKCAIVKRELVSNQRFIGIIPNENTCSVFLYYLMLSNADRLNHLSRGTIQANLSRVEFEQMMVQMPPLPEQRSIADYLDEKCAAIDALVAEKEKLITDLEAYKKSLIFELVTGKREVA